VVIMRTVTLSLIQEGNGAVRGKKDLLALSNELSIQKGSISTVEKAQMHHISTSGGEFLAVEHGKMKISICKSSSDVKCALEDENERKRHAKIDS
jgi:hypothetical protein